MRLLRKGDPPPEVAGLRRVTNSGRNYPTPDAAIAALRRALAKDGIEVADDLIWARENAPGAICPWDAVALIPE